MTYKLLSGFKDEEWQESTNNINENFKTDVLDN